MNILATSIVGLACSHKWGFPHRQGYRDGSGRFVATGRDIQTCCRCAAERDSLIQFAGARPRVENGGRTLVITSEGQ